MDFLSHTLDILYTALLKAVRGEGWLGREREIYREKGEKMFSFRELSLENLLFYIFHSEKSYV